MKRLCTFLVLLASACAYGQVGPVSITSAECATIGVGAKVSVITFQVTGTWTGTLQPKITVQGQAAANVQVTPSTSSTAASTVTANGIYTAQVNGADTFQVCGNTVASGTANVYLNVSVASKGGAVSGTSGTVTSVATTSPIGGGTITSTGTVTCTTCVVASSPGVGLAHFAGSTQTATSSAVNLAGADVTGALPIANGGTGVATAAANTVFGNATGSTAAPAFTASPSVTSVVVNGATSGTATLSASTTGGTLNLGSTNATMTSAGALTVASCSGCGSGALVLLEQHTAATSASLDFTTCISATYDEYQVEFLGIIPSTDQQDLLVQVGTGGTPTYDTGSNYAFFGLRTSLTGSSASGQVGWFLNEQGDNGVKNTAGQGLSGSMTIYNPATSGTKYAVMHSVYARGFDGAFTFGDHGEYWPTATPVTAFRVLPRSAGTLTSGTVRCYGIAKT